MISIITVIRVAPLPVQAAAFGGLCHLPDGMAAVEQCDAAAAAASPRQRSQGSVFWGIKQHGSNVFKPTAAAHLVSWVALHDRARSAFCCAAIRAVCESPCAVFDPTLIESAVSALQSAYALS